MKKALFILPILVLVLVLTGCASRKTSNPNVKRETETTHGGDTHMAIAAGSRIDLTNQNGLVPGDVTLAFKVYGKSATELTPDDLKVAHEKKMHVIIVRDDVTSYQHLHPEYDSGRWTIKTSIPEPGTYEMYVDIVPAAEPATILRSPLQIGEPTVNKTFPSTSPDMAVIVNGIQAKVTAMETFSEGKVAKFAFTLTRNGQVINVIEPYLGAFGHVIILRHGDVNHYVHAHPVSDTAPKNGIVEYEADFPLSGMYTIFGQFKVSGQILTFPITVEVPKSSSSSESSSDDVHMK